MPLTKITVVALDKPASKCTRKKASKGIIYLRFSNEDSSRLFHPLKKVIYNR